MTRHEEKSICTEIALAASELAQPGLNHAQKYMGRLRLVTAIEALYVAAGLQLPHQIRPRESLSSPFPKPKMVEIGGPQT